MAVFIPEVDEIYFPKTKEYFQEVISSNANGNYRSAVVIYIQLQYATSYLSYKS